MMILLLVGRKTRQWQPLVPTQKCAKVSPNPELRPSDFAGVTPDLLIAGTFQSSQSNGLLRAVELVPSFDGIHVIQQCRPKAYWIFIVCDGQPELADPTMTTIDDIRQTLDAAANRLHFG